MDAASVRTLVEILEREAKDYVIVSKADLARFLAEAPKPSSVSLDDLSSIDIMSDRWRETLAQLVQQRGITQVQLEVETGIGQGAISRFLAGEMSFRVARRNRLLAALRRAIDEQR